LALLESRFQQSAEGLRLARGMGWSVVGAVCSRGLALLSSFIAARILGRSVFGELGIIQSTTNMYGTFGQLGGLTAIKHVAEFRTKDPDRAGRVIALSILVSMAGGVAIGTLMFASSPWAARLLAAPHLRGAIATSAFVVFLVLLNETLDGVLSGFEAFKRRSRVQFLSGLASFPLIVLGILSFGLLGAVWGLIGAQAVQALLTWQAIRTETALAGVRIRWREARQDIGVLATFSLPTLCSGAVYVPAMWVANMVLVNSPGGYAEMGIFNAADRWRTAILLLPSLLGSVTLPMLANLRGEAASSRYHQLLWSNIRLSILASVLVATPVALLAPRIMAHFGPEFAEGTWVLIILCTTSIAFAAYWMVGQSLVSRGHVWTMFLFNLAWAATLLASEWMLRGQGAAGLAVAYLTADVGRLTLALIYANRMRIADGSASATPLTSIPPSAIIRDAG
jgi:O-antigen/teichoic acid export membrane protein